MRAIVVIFAIFLSSCAGANCWTANGDEDDFVLTCGVSYQI